MCLNIIVFLFKKENNYFLSWQSKVLFRCSLFIASILWCFLLHTSSLLWCINSTRGHVQGTDIVCTFALPLLTILLLCFHYCFALCNIIWGLFLLNRAAFLIRKLEKQILMWNINIPMRWLLERKESSLTATTTSFCLLTTVSLLNSEGRSFFAQHSNRNWPKGVHLSAVEILSVEKRRIKAPLLWRS